MREPDTISALRYAVIGAGAAVFDAHRPALNLSEVELVGLCDVNGEVARTLGGELDCPWFTDHARMLQRVGPDVVVILAPHFLHETLTLDCLARGCHVLVEKPMAVEIAQADRMIEAAVDADRLLAVNLQHRHRPEVRAAKQILASNRLGQIQRVEATQAWTRTRAYYRQGAWRATWRGEGGGVVMNQAPHNLDLLCHLLGLPRQVFAWTRTQLHDIETEDTAHALLEWADGALGYMHISSAEANQPETTEIIGTRGRLRICRGAIDLAQLEVDLKEHIATSQRPFASPALTSHPVDVQGAFRGHADVYINVNAAIREGKPLVSDGVEGRKSLELSNAIIASGRTGAPIELPLDPASYSQLLGGLVQAGPCAPAVPSGASGRA